MKDFKIKTTLGVVPSFATQKKNADIFITRGATAKLTINLMNKSYTFDQIRQLAVAIKSANGDVFYAKMFLEDGAIDPHFKRSKGPSYDFIGFTLYPEETANFEPTKQGNPMSFEVSVSLDGEQGIYTLIAKQPYISVADSLFGDIIKGE